MLPYHQTLLSLTAITNCCVLFYKKYLHLGTQSYCIVNTLCIITINILLLINGMVSTWNVGMFEDF